MAGLTTEVEVHGTLNDDGVVSDGWEALTAIPWASLSSVAGRDMKEWASTEGLRVFFARFQHFNGSASPTTAAWCLTPHGRLDSHRPEMFTHVLF